MDRNEMFKKLNEEEEEEFKKWARANYKPGTRIDTLAHPIIRAECEQMNIEKINARKEGEKEPRKICEIANDIVKHWSKISPAAQPYLEAMLDLDTIDDIYFNNPAEDIIRYFLSNSQYWRGNDAKRIKAELNSLLS